MRCCRRDAPSSRQPNNIVRGPCAHADGLSDLGGAPRWVCTLHFPFLDKNLYSSLIYQDEMSPPVETLEMTHNHVQALNPP